VSRERNDPPWRARCLLRDATCSSSVSVLVAGIARRDLRFTCSAHALPPVPVQCWPSCPNRTRACFTSVAVTAPAAISRPNAADCPAYSGVKSLLPPNSALARNGVTSVRGSGKSGKVPAIGPTSRVNRLAITRAGRPVNTFVNTVESALAPRRASRCIAGVAASGQRRYTVPT
jgi:hypothetical protein